MKKRTLEKLGIIILSAMLIATPVAAPFTTMTVYAEDVAAGGSLSENNGTVYMNNGTVYMNNGTVDNNNGIININKGTINNNSGEVDEIWRSGKVENNLAGATINGNYGTVSSNNSGATINENYGTVSSNNSGGTIKFSSFIVTTNEGNIEVNDGRVEDNNFGGHIDKNNNSVNNNSGIITENYGNVGNNTGTIANNYTSVDGYVDGYYGVVDKNNGTIQNQWYEVKLENNTTELTIKGNSIKDIDDSGNTDVFAHQASSITIYSTNPNKIIDALAGDIVYVKNADGSITISNIQNPYSILTTLVDKIIEQEPTPVAPAPAPEKNNSEKTDKAEVVIEISVPNNDIVAPVQPQVATPAVVVNTTTTVAENPAAAVKAAIAIQNDPVIVELAQQSATRMVAVNTANKDAVVKELAAIPNQAVVGSDEYAAKQSAIFNDIFIQMASINQINVQSLAVMQKTGIAVALGGCTKLDKVNATLLNDLLAKGMPVTLTFARNGKPVTIKIPAGVDLTTFIGKDGRIDLTKLKAYIVK